jgi:mono/diheme cytochrome c family protein
MTRPHTNLLLGALAALTTLLVLVVAGEAEAGRMARRTQMQNAMQIEAGAILFAEHCRNCHGINGEGVGQLGSALNDRAFFADRLREVGWPGTLDEFIQHAIAEGRITATRPLYAGDGNVAMAAWAQAYGGPLRPDEIRSLAAYVRNWEATAAGRFKPAVLAIPTPERGSSAAQVARGSQLFRTAGCATCHAAPGSGDATVAPNLARIGATAKTRVSGYSAEDYLRESFLIPNAFIVAGYGPNLGCGGVLTHEQLDDLVSYLLSLE